MGWGQNSITSSYKTIKKDVELLIPILKQWEN